jgi:transcriptional regulator with XRE-family HTH domain
MARTDAGLTISELAKRAGVSRDTISNAERGQHSLQAPTLNKLARALGKTPSELLALEEKLAPKVPRRSSLEPSLNDVLAEGRREDINEVALEAARRQLTQDRQAAARASESERPQTYFMRHDNEGIARLMQYSPDELADSLMELARGYVELQERRQLSLEDFPAEQVAAFLAENERDNERIKRELEKMSAKEFREALLTVVPRLRKYYREESTSREILKEEQGKSA